MTTQLARGVWFEWNEARAKAAVLVAEDEFTDAVIAEMCGIGLRTLTDLKKEPVFIEKVAEHVAEIERAMLRHAIARRHRRIGKMDRALTKIEQVIDRRAEVAGDVGRTALRDVLGAAAPGAESGLLVSKPVWSHDGDLAYEWKFDAALIKEYRALMEQAAKELGQLSEKLEISGEILQRQYVGVDIDKV
jgi:hypothetical protein